MASLQGCSETKPKTHTAGSLINSIGNTLAQRFRQDQQLDISKQIAAIMPTIHTSAIHSPTDTVSTCLPSPSGSSTSAASSEEGSRKRGPSASEYSVVDAPQAKKVKEEGEEFMSSSDSDSMTIGGGLEDSFLSSLVPLATGRVGQLEDIFMQVPGRLSLLTSSNRYKVSYGEIQRRLGQPENLNASILGAILRRAKSKNGGKELRAILEHHGMHLPAGRRKTTQITLFTSMVEGEAEHLAKDFEYVCNNEFPAVEYAQMAALKQYKEKKDVEARKRELIAAGNVIGELMSLIDAAKEFENMSTQVPLENFQLLTHGFGQPALMTGFSTVMKYINAQMGFLNNKPAEAPVRVPAPVVPVATATVQSLLSMAPAAAAAPVANPLQALSSLFPTNGDLSLQLLLQLCQQRNVM